MTSRAQEADEVAPVLQVRPAVRADARATTEGDPPVASAPSGRHVHAHPGEHEYIKVAAVLALLTIAEVGAYYVRSLEGLLTPILLVLMVSKFAIVLMWFMHLRFDSRLFRVLFFLGLGEAMAVFSGVLATFHIWNPRR